jgi:hypothetical protein
MSDQERIWLVWSNEHGMWWRTGQMGYTRVIGEAVAHRHPYFPTEPGQMGYTRVSGEAGRYTFVEAKSICDGANAHQKKSEIPNEVMLLSPEASTALMNACATIPVTELRDRAAST